MPRRKAAAKKTPAITYLSLVIGLIAIVVSGVSFIEFQHLQSETGMLSAQISALSNTTAQELKNLPAQQSNVTVAPAKQQLQAYDIQSQLIIPPSSLAAYPVITTNQTFGNRLTDINMPFNQSELSVINDAPLSYYQDAGEMFLNGSLSADSIGNIGANVPVFTVNGKPSVIYLGSITCIFCGENRWAMALALGKLGNFTALYKGYSSIHDEDVPTVYWRPATYNGSMIDLGSFYNSSYINFIAMEDTMPISGGFDLEQSSSMQKQINATGNLAYKDAFEFITQIGTFQGTPYTVWGSHVVNGADAVVFGNLNQSYSSSLPLTYMTHDQVLARLKSFNDSFSWAEYAAADVYLAQVCPSITNPPPVCSLSAITGIEKAAGITS